MSWRKEYPGKPTDEHLDALEEAKTALHRVERKRDLWLIEDGIERSKEAAEEARKSKEKSLASETAVEDRSEEAVEEAVADAGASAMDEPIEAQEEDVANDRE